MVDAGRALWRPTALQLGVATLGLGAALLVPIAFSDPNGVDPYLVRLSGTSLLMLGAGLALAGLARARAMLIALASVATTYTLLSAGPRVIQGVFGGAAPLGVAPIFWASLAQALLTIAFAVAARRLPAVADRPRLRLALPSARAWLLTAAGIGILVLVGLAIPATLLGREGLAPVALARDLPWLAPACALQAFAQEAQFRGMLLGTLERTLSPGWANLAQAAVFGLAHLAIAYGGPEAPFVPVTFVFGLAIGWVAQRTGSLWPATILHAAADIALTSTVLPGLYGL